MVENYFCWWKELAADYEDYQDLDAFCLINFRLVRIQIFIFFKIPGLKEETEDSKNFTSKFPPHFICNLIPLSVCWWQIVIEAGVGVRQSRPRPPSSHQVCFSDFDPSLLKHELSQTNENDWVLKATTVNQF